MGRRFAVIVSIALAVGAVLGSGSHAAAQSGVLNSPQAFAAVDDLVWTGRAQMRTPRETFALVAASNGKVYAIGGDSQGIVEEYDPRTDTWRPRANMPTPRVSLGAAAAPNGRIYAIGGVVQGVRFRTVEEYDPETDTWRSRADMPTARFGLAVVAASNGKLYAIGGRFTAAVEEYDPETDVWRSRAPMPSQRQHLGAAEVNGKIYAIGGLFGINVVEDYDPVTDNWRSRASMPTARGGLGVTVSSGKIYAIGGRITDSHPLIAVNTVEEYDPATDAWRARAGMPTARAFLGVTTATNGKIYAMGGNGYPGGSEVVEEATVPTDTIAPTTTATPAPPPNSSGLSAGDVTVSLNATDNRDGLGVKEITYSATGAQPIASTTVPGATTSFSITADGETTISYFAKDNSDNAEQPKTLTIKIQRNRPPAAQAGADQTVKEGETVTLNAGGSSDPDGDALRVCE